MDLADIAQLPQRMYNTANLLKQLTESTGVKLYLVDKIFNEIYFCPKGDVVSGHRISWSISLKIYYNCILLLGVLYMFVV